MFVLFFSLLSEDALAVSSFDTIAQSLHQKFSKNEHFQIGCAMVCIVRKVWTLFNNWRPFNAKTLAKTDSEVDASQCKFSKLELVYGLVMGGSKVHSQVQACCKCHAYTDDQLVLTCIWIWAVDQRQCKSLQVFYHLAHLLALACVDVRLTSLGARGFLREEPWSSKKRKEGEGEKTSGCPRQLIDLTAPIDLN